MNYMSENGIETRTFFYPLHKQPCYLKKQKRFFSNPFKVKENFDVSMKI